MKQTSVPAILLFALFGTAAVAANAGDNIALGKPATASSVESSYLTPDLAVDGDPDTRWSSDFTDHNWITVDLEDRYDLTSITLHWQNSYSEDYDIKVSDDGANWTTVESVIGSDGGIDQLSLSATARYVRVEGYSRATDWGHSLWELEVQGELHVPETVDTATDNIALNKAVSSSSVEKDSLGPENAVDGSLDTRWSSDFSDHNWITVDLAQRHQLSGITLRWENAYSKDYDIKISDDGDNWSTIESVNNSDGGVDQLALSGVARYVRVEGYTRSTQWGHSLWELELSGEVYQQEDTTEPEPTGENLAVNKTVFASSTESNDLAPEQAVDGDMQTRWSSDFNDYNWIAVDLGARYDLTSVNIHWESAHSEDYNVQVSDDGNDWTTLASVNGSDGGLDDVSVSGQGRYVRIESLSRATTWGHSIWELAVFGSEATSSSDDTDTTDNTDTTDGTDGTNSGSDDGSTAEPAVSNVSAGKAAVASSTENKHYSADLAVDGSSDTRWSSKFTDHEWIYVDLGEDHQVEQVKLFWQNSYSVDYDVQTSYDGQNWTTVESVQGSDGGLDDLSVSGHGRYVRIEGFRRATKWGHSLWELEVYGYASSEPQTDGGDSTTDDGSDSTTDDGSTDSGSTDTGTDGDGTTDTSDTQAPTVPSGLTATASDSTSVLVDWQASSDDTGVLSYQVYRDGTLLAEVMAPTTQITDDGLTTGATYSYAVRAGDEAGNWSDLSGAVSVTLEETDVTVTGNVQLEWITPDQRNNGDYLELTEIGGYEIRYQEAGMTEPQTVLVNDPYATSYSLDLPDGTYEFSIAVYDASGRYSRFVPIQPVP